MKWFKHDTDALLSEGVDALIDAEGFAGYGRWNRILEIVAFKMDETDRCHVEYSIQKWCRLLGLKQKKLISFLKLIENEMKTKIVHSENIIRIEIPNLLKKRDNYTKNLQVTKKETCKQEVEVEVDREVEVDGKNKGSNGRKEEKESNKLAWKAPSNLNMQAWNDYEAFRKNMPRKDRMTEKAKELAANKLAKSSEEEQREMVDNSIMNSWKGLFELNKPSQQNKNKTTETRGWL